MQIVNLILDHTNFFCPATGERITGGGLSGNDEAISLAGYWIDQVFDEPHFNATELEEAWHEVCKPYLNKDHYDYPDVAALEQFFNGFEMPNWVVFKITTDGIPENPSSITAWFVIDMNTEIEDTE